MKAVRGYIFSRSFLGERAPQHIQNIVIRDFCKKKFFHYLLSASEYRMNKSYSILKNLISNTNDIDGIICYSLLMLPDNELSRIKILNNLILSNLILLFSLITSGKII